MLTTSTLKENNNRGYFSALLSAAILSTTGILIRYLTQTYALPALILAVWRDFFVVVTLVSIFAIVQPNLLKFPRQFLPFLILYGFVLAVFNSTWTLSVALNGAAVATVMVYCSAAFTALLGWWFLKEKLGISKILAVALSLAGVLLVSGALQLSSWNANLLGILTGISAGLCYAIYSLFGRSASFRGLSPWTTLVYTFAFASIFLLGFNLIPGGFLPGAAKHITDFLWPELTLSGWFVLFMLAAIPTVLGFGMYNVSLTYLPSSVVNLIVTLEPVFTSITAYFLFGEILSFIQVLGGLMIVGGVVVIRISEGLKKLK
jgi:drug/metabolite transporter (DMT)-like permease